MLNGAVDQTESFEMKAFLNDESGATAIEYGLIAAGMGLMLLVSAPSLAAAVSTVFGKIVAALLTF